MATFLEFILIFYYKKQKTSYFLMICKIDGDF